MAIATITRRCRTAELPRDGRVTVGWPVTMRSAEAVTGRWWSIEDGPWLDLAVDGNLVVADVAGPECTDPGDAVVVTRTGWCRLRIDTAKTRHTFDGGFIALVDNLGLLP